MFGRVFLAILVRTQDWGNHINVSLTIRIFVATEEDGFVLYATIEERSSKKSNYP